MSTYSSSSFPTFSWPAAYIETESVSKTVSKPTVWKCYTDRWYFSLWDISKPDMVDFFKLKKEVNFLHPTALMAIKFTAEISDTETTFLDPVVYKGTITFNEKWEKAVIIDVKTHFKQKPSSIYISPLTTHQLLKWIWQTRSLENLTNSSEEVFQISKRGWWTRLAKTFWKKNCY